MLLAEERLPGEDAVLATEGGAHRDTTADSDTNEPVVWPGLESTGQVQGVDAI